MTERLTIRRPDDWHVHLRDGAMLEAVAHHTARQFARAIVMPNLSPPVTTSAMAAAYRARVLAALVRDFPARKVVLEHITTAEAAAFVGEAGPLVAATITPQHLHINRNAMFDGGLRPHAYCLPVAKRELHRRAVRAAATSGSPSFFLGAASAPHSAARKEAACGCAGVFNAPYALESC